jgi:hypothetical protein
MASRHGGKNPFNADETTVFLKGAENNASSIIFSSLYMLCLK